MRSRHVVLCITQPPGESEPDRALEALRAAVGLVRSTEAHELEIVLEGAASRLLADAPPDARPMLLQLQAADVPFHVTASEAVPVGCDALDESALASLLEGAEVVLRY